MKPRVRFAPSPTGQLHIGGVRTALFNYLFARKNSGKYFMRIEDTDLERSKKEYIDQICESMIWLGLEWDEEIVFQSDRNQLYQDAISNLLDKDRAYLCFSTKNELDIIRDEKDSYLYPGIWRDRHQSDIQEQLDKQTPFTIRLKVPEDKANIVFNDLIYGEITVSYNELDDFIIARSDGSPVYNLTNVVDDHDMGITHIIRGEDHISNTPKQILLYQAFEWDIPKFAHLPMILGRDKKRLSKRHGSIGVQSYRDKGYQPLAFLNYLSLLGWNPGNDEEVMSLDEIINKFELKKVHKNSAVFDEKKFNWISGQHLSLQLNENILAELKNIDINWGKHLSNDICISIIETMKVRSNSLIELIDQSHYFFHNPDYSNNELFTKILKENTFRILYLIKNILEEIDSWDDQMIEKKIKDFIIEYDFSFGDVMQPIRFAISGTLNGPSVFTILSILGKETCLNRIDNILNMKRND
tara:strand:- start:659 stop:2068 length:1410 start_codon:yes stop_codon:yes gene_type:complete